MDNNNIPDPTPLNQEPQKTSSQLQNDVQTSSLMSGNTTASTVPAYNSYYNYNYTPRSKKPEYIAFKEKVISLKGLYITLASIIFSILFTETILFGSAGISVPILAVVLEGMLFYSFKEKEKPLNKTAVYLSVPILIISLSYFIHYNPETHFITWLTLIGLLCIQVISLSDIKVNEIFSFDMIIKSIVNLVARPFSNYLMPIYSFKILKGRKTKSLTNSIYILIGLAISIPVAAILMSLFMSADAVFAESMNKIIDLIGVNFAIVFWDIVFGCMFGLFLSAMLVGLKYEDIKPTKTAKVGDSIESVIIGTFLTIIDIFTVTFVVFQFMYLFGGTVNITASNMTYAEYARRGFFELSAASGIIFAIALFVIIMTKKKNNKLPIWIQLTTVCLCLCNGVLFVSALKRMLLYVNVYGLSVKRVLTLWFIVIIGLCLIWLIIKCFVSKMHVMNWIGITVIIGVCILSLTNTDRIIANYNVNRYLSSPSETSIDVNYLGQLSYSAVPEIVRLKSLANESSTDFSMHKILQNQKDKISYRHSIYGFTLDRIEASKLLSKN